MKFTLPRYTHPQSILVFILLLFICGIGVGMRFFFLDWGAPFFFHPDERNVASAITRINFESFNPEFFAYGGLPIYAIYFLGVVLNYCASLFGVPIQDIQSVSFENAILISRFYSAIFSCALLLLLYRIRFYMPYFAFLATFVISVFSVGYIQYAHFGTFEMWLTFFTFLFFILTLRFLQKRSLPTFFLGVVVYGALLAIKVSSIFLFPIIPLALFIFFSDKKVLRRIFFSGALTFVAGVISFIVFIVGNPFFILDNPSYVNSLVYEGSVAQGSVVVFYTERFFGTIPILYHFQSVFPFLLNPLNTLLLVVAIPVCIWYFFKKRNLFLLLTFIFFFVLFLTQTFLYVKWNRYMVPLLPYAYILIGWLLNIIFSRVSFLSNVKMRYGVICAIGVCAFIFSVAHFVTTYREDSRLAAFRWALVNIPHDSAIASEIYDLGLVPFEGFFSNIKIFNQYEIERDPTQRDLSSYEYVFLPSQRVLRSRIELPDRFPHGNAFYKNLWEESGEFKLIYSTPCDIWCEIAYIGDPIFILEETSNVFDHPTFQIYQRWENP